MVYITQLECREDNTTLRFAMVVRGTIASGTATLEEHTMTFAEGLYSLSDIRSEINIFCSGKNIPDILLDVIGHTPTQSAEMHWDVQASGCGCIIYMGDADSIRARLGYSEDLISRIQLG